MHQRGSALPSVGHEHPRRQLATSPNRPQYGQATPTVCGSCLGMSVVSTRKTPSRSPSAAPTARKWRPGTTGRIRGCPPPRTAGGAPGQHRHPARAGPYAQPTCAGLRTAAPSESDRNETHWSRRGNRQKTFQAGLQVGMQVRWEVASQRRGRGRDGGLGGTTGAEAHPETYTTTS